jgi:hypothetical protein
MPKQTAPASKLAKPYLNLLSHPRAEGAGRIVKNVLARTEPNLPKILTIIDFQTRYRDDGHRHYITPIVGSASPRGASSCRDCQRRRDRDRMVRFSALQPGGCAGFRQALLPQIGSVGRRNAGFWRLLRGLSLPPHRRGDFRSLRRPHRTQEDIGHDVADDRPCHLCGGLAADLCQYRRLGRCSPDHPPHRPRRRRWR